MAKLSGKALQEMLLAEGAKLYGDAPHPTRDLPVDPLKSLLITRQMYDNLGELAQTARALGEGSAVQLGLMEGLIGDEKVVFIVATRDSRHPTTGDMIQSVTFLARALTYEEFSKISAGGMTPDRVMERRVDPRVEERLRKLPPDRMGQA